MFISEKLINQSKQIDIDKCKRNLQSLVIRYEESKLCYQLAMDEILLFNSWFVLAFFDW